MRTSDIHFAVNASETWVYKTHDTVDGVILFTPHQDTDIDDINVSFQDTSILKSDKKYRISFVFVVPDQLPIHACHHECANSQIRQEHLHPPPSLSHQKHKQNIHDMSPKMAEIAYSIIFTLWQRSGKGGRSKKLQEATYPIQIQPTREEHAPILIPEKNKYYQLHSQTTVSKAKGFDILWSGAVKGFP
ncbi:hypothetical protein PENANT_c018G07485 [Penicillium antarcticum]|uniref:Bul1 N-terminal domain-containing protein n=1 Tax=Penicillium antarcticum TaxID=416450 RepID=A0A1V6Q1H7_9EURO|nr:hypothetical protein PENANT_c018G07485 [Penicillium antarcticum]